MPPRKKTPNKTVEAIKHGKQTRPNIPTAEMEELLPDDTRNTLEIKYPRNKDLDPQLLWTGKDDENQQKLRINAMPIYVQEKIHPQAIINDLKRLTEQKRGAQTATSANLFGDFNGLADAEASVEYYKHQQKWTNRMILGDSLMVMASLAHREGMKGKVQCIYIDPPYGIKFGSNWQTSTKSTNTTETEGTHEPEMIKAFRDTWQLNIHSYLSYLRDRLTAACDLLAESGSIFVQISDENVHLVRCLMDEVFGRENFVSQITMKRASVMFSKALLNSNVFYLLFYCKNKDFIKYKSIFIEQKYSDFTNTGASHLWFYNPSTGAEHQSTPLTRQNVKRYTSENNLDIFQTLGVNAQGIEKQFAYTFQNKQFYPPNGTQWKTSRAGLNLLKKAGRLIVESKSIRYKYHYNDYPVNKIGNLWEGIGAAGNKVYVVQTNEEIIKRCILMTTDPGDLVLDPTCGSGTTASVSEQWGRRWITIDTSRVALAIARARLMGNHYDYYYMQDSKEGAEKESIISGKPSTKQQFNNDIRHDFVYKRVPHITLGDIANNAEIDVIHERYQSESDSLLAAFNQVVGKEHEEWEVPIEADADWGNEIKMAHSAYINLRRRRQQDIDASIAQNSKTELLVDQPEIDRRRVRVTGPFTVESLSPHRILPTDEADEALLAAADAEAEQAGEEVPQRQSRRLRPKSETDNEAKFIQVIFDNLKTSGIKNTRKKERLEFSEIEAWANSRQIQFIGHYSENGKDKKAAICVGPEYGTVTRSQLLQAAREAADYFDIVIFMGFAFEAHADKDSLNIGKMEVLRVRLNNELHMADRLRSGSNDNLFVVFGEPDIVCEKTADDNWQVEIKGIDIYNPKTGETRASDVKDIACWMIDTDYNEESFFARHVYFTGGGKDPYKKLKRTLRAEIDEEEWESLASPTSRPFLTPTTGKIAVKAINHYGDEVIKIFEIPPQA